MKRGMPSRAMLETALDVLLQALVFYYIAGYFSPEHLLSKTTATGGDMASHYYTAQYLTEHLLPHGKILGWMQGNYAGFPVFQFYFPLPFVLMALLAPIIGLQIAFKVISVLGIFLLPICTYFGFRLMGFRFPTPSLASLFTLPFLFMEANSMWGGNIPSTLAGEFTYSIGLALMVLFAGSCYRGILENRWAVRNGVLLALIGFNHGYTLLFAGAFSSYFLLAFPGSGRILRYLVKVNALAFCLMGFWIIPLLGYMPITTRYNEIWTINSWTEILPPILWPGLALSAAFTLYKLVRLARPKWREPFDHRVGLLWYILGLSYLFYLVAFRIHVVDIRFLPFLQLFLCLLAAVPIGLMAPRMKAAWLVPVIVALCTVLWTDHNVTFIRQWVAWNYSGFEKKTLWPAFSRVNLALKGTEADPRVVYEHSSDHNAAGTPRAFESLPLFSGRNTLEGLYMQSSISSPFIFYIQSEISKETSCPLPDYHCTRQNLERGAEHLRLFNVSDFIVRSDAVKQAIRESPDFEPRASFPPFDIYRVRNNENRYVVPLKYQPVLLQTQDWKSDFYTWFKRPGTSSVPLVHLFDGKAVDEARFALRQAALPAEIPRLPINGEVQVTEQISQEEIRITTNKIGHPLLIKISYHPRWRVEGADRVYLASPSFMLIYPTQTNVRLVFGDPPLARFGQLLTLLAVCLVLASWRPIRTRAMPLWARAAHFERRLASTRVGSLAAALFNWYERRRPWLAPAVVFLAVLVAVLFSFSSQQTDSRMLYNQGSEEYNKERYEQAARLFEKAMTHNPNSASAIHANYYYALCFFKQKQWQKTIDVFTRMIARYPDSAYVPEAEQHIARSLRSLGREQEAVAKFQSIISRYPASPWAGHARDQLNIDAAFNEGLKLFTKEHYEEAARQFEKSMNENSNSPSAIHANYYYALSFFKQNQWERTIDIFARMIAKFPDSAYVPEAEQHIARSLRNLGREDEAVAKFQSIISRYPTSPWAGHARNQLNAKDRVRDIRK